MNKSLFHKSTLLNSAGWKIFGYSAQINLVKLCRMRILHYLTLLICAGWVGKAYAVTEFVSTIRATGGDYSLLSTWEASTQCDLTSTQTQVFSHSGITGTVADGDIVTGATSGTIGTVVHATSTQILIKNIRTALTGTLTFTNGSTAVTGVGTAFTTEVAAGDYIWLDADGVWAQVSSVTDDTNLVLSAAYSGTGGTGSGAVYKGSFTSGEQVKVDAADYVTITDAGDSAIAVAECYNDWPGGLDDSVTIDGWTTNATNYVKLTVAEGNRHNGIAGTGFVLDPDSGVDITAVDVKENYTKIEYFEIDGTQTTGYAGALIGVSPSTDYVSIHNCLLYNGPYSGIKVAGGCDYTYIWNNIIYGCATSGEAGIYLDTSYSSLLSYLYNNTVIDCGTGIEVVGTNGTVVAKNNLCQGSGTNFSGIFDSSSDYNVSSDTTSTGGVHDRVSQSTTFIDVANKDYHLSINDETALGFGEDLSSDSNLSFSSDIDLQRRAGRWDIGADHYKIHPLKVSYTAGYATITVTSGDASSKEDFKLIFSEADAGVSTVEKGTGVAGTWGTNLCSATSLLVNTGQDLTGLSTSELSLLKASPTEVVIQNKFTQGTIISTETYHIYPTGVVVVDATGTGITAMNFDADFSVTSATAHTDGYHGMVEIIETNSAAKDDYENPDTLVIYDGILENNREFDYNLDGFEEGQGVYSIIASSNIVKFDIDGSTYDRYNPRFLIEEFYPETGSPVVEHTDFHSRLDSSIDIASPQRGGVASIYGVDGTDYEFVPAVRGDGFKQLTSSGYIEIPDSNISAVNGDKFTIDFTLIPSADAALGTGQQYILNYITPANASAVGAWKFYYDMTNNKWTFSYTVTGPTELTATGAYNDLTFKAGDRIHIRLVLDAPNGIAKIYQNGILYAESDGTVSGSGAKNLSNIRMMEAVDGTSAATNWTIDDIYIYDDCIFPYGAFLVDRYDNFIHRDSDIIFYDSLSSLTADADYSFGSGTRSEDGTAINLSGIDGSAVVLDYASDFQRFLTEGNISKTQGSLGIWVKSTSATNPTASQYIFYADSNFNIYFDSYGYLNFKVGSLTTLQDAEDLYDGKWHWIKATWDYINDTYSLSVDGEIKATDTTSLDATQPETYFYIGNSSAQNAAFIGLVDEIYITLSPDTPEIQTLYGKPINYPAVTVNNGVIPEEDYSISAGDNAATYIIQVLDTIRGIGSIYLAETNLSSAVTSNGSGGGDWSNASTWSSGQIPSANEDVTISAGDTVTISGGELSAKSITVEAGATLEVNTNGSDKLLVVKGNITVNGTLRIRSSSDASYGTYIKFDCDSNGEYGIIVTGTGLLDVEGTSKSDQDVYITALTQDGAHNAYIYCEADSECHIKYADISYMGLNAGDKYGIYVEDVDGSSSGEGFSIEASKIHNGYEGIVLNGSKYAVIKEDEIYQISQKGIEEAGVILSSMIIDNLIGETGGEGIHIIGSGETITGNIIYATGTRGIEVSGTGDIIRNNTICGGKDDGIWIEGANTIIKDNQICYQATAGEGIDDDGTGSIIDYNLFYGNVLDGATGTNAITGLAPNFYNFDNSPGGNDNGGLARSVASATSNTLTASSPGWTTDQWAGYVVWVDDDFSTPAGGEFRYILSNTTDTLTIAGTWDTTPDATYEFKIIDFTVGANSPGLGAGVNTVSGTASDITNIGAITDYIRSTTDSNKEYNSLQLAHNNDSTGAGDTITTYANDLLSSVVSGDATGIGNGIYSVTINEDILTDDIYNGYYLYITAGADRGKYYLIVDTDATNDQLWIFDPTETASIHANDRITIIDRIYNRKGYDDNAGTTALVQFSKDGTATSPITWNTSGEVILEGGNYIKYGIYLDGANYNTIDGFIIRDFSYGINSNSAGYNKYQNEEFYNNTTVGLKTGTNSKATGNFSKGDNRGIDIDSSTVAEDNIVTDSDASGIYLLGEESLLENNIIFNTGGVGIYAYTGSNSVIRGNKIFKNSSYNIQIGNTTIEGVQVRNNTIFSSNSDNIYLSSGATNNKIYNNIIVYGVSGIEDNDATVSNAYDFNFYYGNTTDHTGYGAEGSNSITGYEADFKSVATGTATTASSTTMIVDTTKNWAANQWVGYAVKVTIAATGDTYWAGVVSNTSDHLYLSPGLGSAPNSGTDTYIITDFSVNGTTLTTTPLGQGCRADGVSEPGTVNMGAILDFVKNETDGKVFNSMQDAHDDATLTAGDTVTTYAVNEVEDATIGSTITDLGSMVQFDVSEAAITEDNQYEGMYLYIEAGENRGRYYLIVDTKENVLAVDGTDTDTITVLTDDATGFHEGDEFKIVDRVYTRPYTPGGDSLVNLSKSGTATAAITWNTNGKVILDGEGDIDYGIKLNSSDYNIIDGYTIERIKQDGIYVGGSYEKIINNKILDNDATGINLVNTNDSNISENDISAIEGGSSPYGITISDGSEGNSIRYNKVYDINGVGINTYGEYNVVDGNKIFGSESKGMYLIGASGNTIHNNILFSTVSDAMYIDSNSGSNNILNNSIINSGVDGINIVGTANKLANNILSYNTGDGIEDDDGTGSNSYVFNYFYSNGGYDIKDSTGASVTPDANSITGTAPGFATADSGTAATTSTTAMIVDTTKNWTANQWVGYAVKVTIAATGYTYWAGITSNTASRLYLAPALDVAPNSGTDTYIITDFSIAGTSSAVTPLGQGCQADGVTEPGTVNMGAHLGYIYNSSQSLKENKLQWANEDASAGDNINLYSVTEVATGTIGASITDLGCMVQLDVDEASITADNQYEGMYMYMTAGTNAGKAYLIVDSKENVLADDGTDTDTITILTDDTTGFTANTDTFSIIDREYNERDPVRDANFRLSTSGTSTSFISYDPSGTIVLDGENEKAYNVYGESGITGVKISDSIKFQNATTTTFGGQSYSSHLSGYYRWGSETITATSSGNWTDTATWAGGVVPTDGQVAVIPAGVTVTIDSANLTVGDGTSTSAITIEDGGTLQFDTSLASDTVLTVKGNITVNGTLRIRSSSDASYGTYIKFDCDSNGEYGIIVTGTGLLDVEGTSKSDQDVYITALTQDGAHNAYIYCEADSECHIKYADISYMGLNAGDKYGIYVEDVDGSSSGEGFSIEASKIHNGYEGIVLNGSKYAVIKEDEIYQISQKGIEEAGVILSSMIIDNLIGETGGEGIHIIGSGETITGNIIYATGTRGIEVSGTGDIIRNNTICGGKDDGIWIEGANTIIKDNQICYQATAGEGIDDDGTGSIIDYNLFYGNVLDGATGTNAITGLAPNFYNFDNSPGGNDNGGLARSVASATSNTLTASSPGWTTDQWAGYVVWVDDDFSTPAGGEFRYILSNTTDTLTIAGTWDTTPDATYEFKIIDFTVGANSPGLGAGVNTVSGTASDITNIGAITDYIRSTTDSNKEYNSLQLAHNNDSTGAGDTITTYANDLLSSVVSGDATGIGNGIYSVTINEDILTDDIYNGYYLYITAGADRGKYYLIVDTDATNDQLWIFDPTETASIHANDRITIIDRIYNRKGYDDNAGTTALVQFSKDGTATSPITWNTSGEVILEGGNYIKYGIYLDGANYNTIDGFIIRDFSYGINSNSAGYNKYQNEEFYNNTTVGLKTGTNSKATGNFSKGDNRGIDIDSSTVAEDNIVTDSDASGIYLLGEESLLENNIIFNTGGVGIYAYTGSNSVIRGNKIFKNSSYNIQIGNTTIEGVQVRNNTIFSSNSDNIYLSSGATNNKIYNNIIVYGVSGIEDNDATVSNAYDFNFYYGNTTDHTGYGAEGSNSITGYEADFKSVATGTATTASSTTMIVDTTKNWAANQWVGYAVKVTIAATGDTYWAGVVSNTSDHLYLSPGLGSAPNSGTDTYIITDFSVNGTTLTTTPLGQGCRADGVSEPGTVNMGAILDFVKNETDGKVFNSMQDAHDDATLTAGDTVTTYAVNEVEDATIGSTITDLGSMVQFDVSEAAITEDNQYEGMYLYIEAGENRGRYYLIVDTKENVLAVDGTDTDTITVLTDDATGFHEGDEFKIVDRVYTRPYTPGGDSLVNLSKSGTATAAITWNTNGKVILDGRNNNVSDGIYLAGVMDNIIDGFVIQNVTDTGIEQPASSFASSNVIRNNVIHSCYRGMLSYGQRDIVNNNLIYSCTGDPIEIVPGFASHIINNIFYSNNGIFYLMVGGSLIDSNVFFDDNVRLRTSNVTATKNIVVGGHILLGDGGTYQNISLLHNTIVNGDDGIRIALGTTNCKLRDNILVYNTDDGLDDDDTSGTNSYDFNFYYGNATDYEGTQAIGTNSITGTDPGFKTIDSGTATTDSTTTMIVDTTKNWTANQWVGYAVKVTIAATGYTYWAGITSNTASRLYLAPALDVAPNSGTDTYIITDFSIAGTSSAVTPLGQGCQADGVTEPGTVNMGAHLGYIYNTAESKKFNKLQYANDDSGLSAGDSLSIYSVTEVATGTIGASITDLGCMVQLDVDEASITADNQYEGMYMYMSSGTNAGKAYLIVDSQENVLATDGTDTDTITILADSATGFTASSDTFSIIDRVYSDKATHSNLDLSKSGSGGTRITWRNSGTVVLDAGSVKDYNIYAASGLSSVKVSTGLKFMNANLSSYGGDSYTFEEEGYYVWGAQGSLSSVSVTHDSYLTGATTNTTISFTAQNSIPVNGDIEVTFPAGYDLSGTLAVVSGNTGATVSSSGQTLIINLGTAVASGESVSIVVSGIVNPTTVGEAGGYSIETQDEDDVTIDTGTAVTNNFRPFRFTSPVSGDIWAAGSVHTITFETSGVTEPYTIQYYENGSWYTVKDSAGNPAVNVTGTTQEWLVPSTLTITSSEQLRILENANPTLNYALSDVFSISGGIVINSPTTSSVWALNSAHTIIWIEYGDFSSGVKLEYYDGTAWQPITGGGTDNNGIVGTVVSYNADGSVTRSFTWTPSVEGITEGYTNCNIRISDANTSNPPGYDTSGAFTIAGIKVSYTPPDRGNTAVAVGATAQTISWTGTGLSYVKLQYYSNTAGGYVDISGAEAIDASLGSYSWTVPDDVGVGNVYVRAVAVGADGAESTSGIEGSVSDTLDTPFTIYGSLALTSTYNGTIYKVDDATDRVPITWTGSSSIDAVTLEYTKSNIAPSYVNLTDEGTLYTTATGSTVGYNWSGGIGSAYWQPTVTGTTFWVRVKDANDAETVSPLGGAGDYFTVTGVSITSLSETSPFSVGDTVTINGLGAGALSVQAYYATSESDAENKTGSITSIGVVSVAGDDTFSINWTVPDNICSTVYLRVENVADPTVHNVYGPYVIRGKVTIDDPIDTNWVVGETTNDISGTVIGDVDYITLQYTTVDNPTESDWHDLTTAPVSIGDNSGTTVATWTLTDAFTVPDAISSNFKIRAIDGTPLRDTTLVGKSEAITNSITVKGALSVTTPSSDWFASGPGTINWEATGSIGDVVIEYQSSKDNALDPWSDWTAIATVPSGGTGTDAVSGSYDWDSVADVVLAEVGAANIQSDPDVFMRIRVRDADDSTVYAETNPFTVRYVTVTWQVKDPNGNYVSGLNVNELSTATPVKSAWSVTDNTFDGNNTVRYYPYNGNTTTQEAYTTTFSRVEDGITYSVTKSNWRADTDKTVLTVIETAATANIVYAVDMDLNYDSTNDRVDVIAWLTKKGLLVDNISLDNTVAISTNVYDTNGNKLNDSDLALGVTPDSNGIFSGISFAPVGGLDPSASYVFKTTITYFGVDYTGTAIFRVPSAYVYSVKLTADHDNANDSIVLNAWLDRSGTTVSQPGDMTYKVYDSSGNVVATGSLDGYDSVTDTAHDSHLQSNGVYMNVEAYDPTTGLSDNEIYTIEVSVSYKGKTYQGRTTFVKNSSEIATYVYTKYSYDADNDKLNLNVWLEREGSLITNPSSVSVVVCDSKGNVLDTLGSGETPDANGVFWLSMSASDMKSGEVYFAKASIVYNGTTYSSGQGIAITIDKDLESLSAAQASEASTQSAFRTATTSTLTTIEAATSSISTNVGSMSTKLDTVSNQVSSVASQMSTVSTYVEAILEDTSSILPSKILSTAKRGVLSEIVTRDTNLAKDDTITIRFRTASGLEPTMTLYDPDGNVVSGYDGVKMKEIGTTGIYEHDITSSDSWKAGDYTVVCEESTQDAYDSMVLTVGSGVSSDLSSAIAELSANTEAIANILGSSSSTDTNTVYGLLSSVEGAVSGLSTTVNDTRVAKNTSLDIQAKIEKIKKQIENGEVTSKSLQDLVEQIESMKANLQKVAGQIKKEVGSAQVYVGVVGEESPSKKGKEAGGTVNIEGVSKMGATSKAGKAAKKKTSNKRTASNGVVYVKSEEKTKTESHKKSVFTEEDRLKLKEVSNDIEELTAMVKVLKKMMEEKTTEPIVEGWFESE